jgi:cellulose synthase/poly-beta-1,6-N-acetylglucosamine synthase-like glycosyltransferase
MSLLSNPGWIAPYKYPFDCLADVPEAVFDEINTRLDAQQTAHPATETPLVSILIAAYNEEINILRCVSTLANLKTNVPFEIIAINNNSADHTQDTMNKLHIGRLFQPIQGCGPARQLGQETARGTYILLADADCLYPQNWLDEMLSKLQKPGVVCVYGRYSFIATPDIPRWQLVLHETMKDLVAELRHAKRPYLNAYGISMGYLKSAGLAAGYIMHNTWGDDGRLCFDMMPYGTVAAMKTRSARVWTGPRSLLRDGTLWQAIGKRIRTEVGRAFSYFTPHPPHDTKTSKN